MPRNRWAEFMDRLVPGPENNYRENNAEASLVFPFLEIS